MGVVCARRGRLLLLAGLGSRPDGHGLIFGTFLAALAALVTAETLQWAFPRHRRVWAAGLTTAPLALGPVLLRDARLSSR